MRKKKDGEDSGAHEQQAEVGAEHAAAGEDPERHQPCWTRPRTDPLTVDAVNERRLRRTGRVDVSRAVLRRFCVSAGEVPGVDDGQQLKFGVVLAAGFGGEEHEGLAVVLGEQDLASQLDRSEFGMDDRLGVIAAAGDVVPVPDPLELRAVLA